MNKCKKIFVIPTHNHVVERVLVNSNLEYQRIEDITADNIDKMPTNSVVFWDEGCWQPENEDSNEIDISLYNTELWSRFFEKNNQLILQPWENYKLIMQAGEGYIQAANLLNEYSQYKHNIIFLSSGIFRNKQSNYNFWSIGPIEFLSMFMPFDYFENNYVRKNNFCLLTNIKTSRPNRKKFISYLKSNSDYLDRENNIVSLAMSRDFDLTKVDRDQASTFTQLLATQKNSRLDIVLETNDNAEFTIVSDKIIKSIISKTPFIVIADPHYYQVLHKLGFKTFSSVIDESWTTMPSSDEKWQKILETLDYIDQIGYENFYKKVQPIVNHNFDKCKSVIFDNLHYEQKRVLDFLSEYGIIEP